MRVSFRQLLPFVALVAATGAAHAETSDTFITVEHVVRSERVWPSPRVIHGRTTVNIVLHANGTVDDAVSSYGRFGGTSQREHRLGESTYKVVDDHTIRRVTHIGDQTRTLTITVSGRTCHATLELSMKPGVTEYRSFATALGRQASFRDAVVEQVTCSIR